MDQNTIVTLCIIGYGLVSLLIFFLGAKYKDKVVGEPGDDPFEHDDKETTYTMNIVMCGFLWPLAILAFLIIIFIDFIKNLVK